MVTQARLQLRWQEAPSDDDGFGTRNWVCKYELWIPLDEFDIRREGEDGRKVRDAHVVELCSTKRGSTREPCRTDGGGYCFDAPFRDGAHAEWDAAKLGGLPIVSIAVDGTIIPKPAKPEGRS